MKPEPSIFDQVPETDAELDESAMIEAEADMKAGRVVPHADVAKWLKTWGTAEEAPAPAQWLK
jgi:predicted transcriptional regulator